MAGSPAAPVASPLGALAGAYDVPEPEEVEPFLRRHPELLDLLAEIPTVLPRYFPGHSRPILHLSIDYEDEGDDLLFVRVPTNLPMPEARARLAEFDHGWWLDRWRPVIGTLIVDVK